MADLYCPKCKKTMRDVNFYQYKDGTKCELCKSCLTMHVNNYDPDTYLWILEKFNVAYNEDFWKDIRDKAYKKNPHKMNGTTVLGKYLSKMKLKQYKEWDWSRTKEWEEKRKLEASLYGNKNEKTEQELAEMEEAYHNGEITEAQWLTYKEINKPDEVPEVNFIDADGAVTTTAPGQGSPSPYPANEHPFEVVDLPDVGAELTAEDKIYLATKWGQLYQPANWVYLEKKYEDFMNSFDIQGAARIDTLIQICKLSLKMNQALDMGDMDSYSKLVRAYDSLMKSAKFTEAQRKEEKSGDFDAVGQIVYFAEKEGGKISRYKIDTPLDIVDEAINNLKQYNHDLVVNDPALSQMFENFIKKRENAAAQKEDLKKARAEGQTYVTLKDKDYQDFYDAVAAWEEQDQKEEEKEEE